MDLQTDTQSQDLTFTMNSNPLLLVAAMIVCGLLSPSTGNAQNQLAGTNGGATFYSMQKPLEPPLPFNRWPDLPVVSVGSGILLIDDRGVNYTALEAENALLAALLGIEAGPLGGGQQQTSIGGADYCYSLSLRIAQSSNLVILTITNALPNHVCLLWTNGDLNIST